MVNIIQFNYYDVEPNKRSIRRSKYSEKLKLQKSVERNPFLEENKVINKMMNNYMLEFTNCE